MCYSSMEDESLKKLAKFSPDAEVRMNALNELQRRQLRHLSETKIPLRITRALEMEILRSGDPALAETAGLIRQLREQRRTELQSGLFTQRTRLVKAERALVARETKKALEEKRIASNKVIDTTRKRLLTQKHDVRRETPLEGDDLERGGLEDALAGPSPTPSQVVMADERWQRLIEGLPPGHRRVLELLRDGHTHLDIARTLGVHPKLIQRLVARLREQAEEP